ncbi:MAG: ATP-binding protein [Candidatus Omnitrophica bacterium]|nr:ATP-binding protein [Candidatus Omnitrophota bacterium]MCF7893336.1 ATP-binding protein [Candidatus Omnitrophota bacterium]
MIINEEIKLFPQEVPSFTKKIIKKLKINGIKEKVLFDIKLALNEALINAIKHGNKSDKKKSVFLKITRQKDKLEICIEDQGKGFDYQNLQLPTDENNLTKQSGRGVFLIKNFMDELVFFNQGCKLKMVKHLNREGR